jgi:heptosyltransferase-2
MHIAAALGVPVVAIFGATHPLDSHKMWGPWGEGHIVVTKDLDCSPCRPGECKDRKCMDLISPDQVLEAAKKQLKKLREKK